MLFEWPIVPRSNWYEIWFKANDGAPLVKYGERKPWIARWTSNVSAHLLNWSQVRWEVRACNPSGCSSSGIIDTGSTVVNTVGFVKTQHPVAEARFGTAVAVSEDGKTLAAIANDEPVAGGMAAAAYFFRSVHGQWTQISRFVVALDPVAGDGEDATISLRNDGELVAIGLPHERFAGAGVNDAGMVHIRHHTPAGGWSQDQIFNNASGGHVGAFSEVNEAGDLIAFSDDSGAGSIQVWRQTNGHWTLSTALPGGNGAGCKFDLSGSGEWLARRCTGTGTPMIEVWNTGTSTIYSTVRPVVPAGYELSGLSINADGTVVATGIRPHDVNASSYVAANWRPTAQVFRRTTTPAFQLVSTFAPNVRQSTAYAKRSLFGDSLTLSHDGGYVAVTDPHDSLGRSGVWPPDEIGGRDAPAWGAVYLFERYTGGYRLRRHIGPYVQDNGAESVMGAAAFGDNGKTLAIAEPLDDSSLTGVGPYLLSQQPIGGSGAVWLY